MLSVVFVEVFEEILTADVLSEIKLYSFLIFLNYSAVLVGVFLFSLRAMFDYCSLLINESVSSRLVG